MTPRSIRRQLQQPTPSEAALWKAIRGCQLGVVFRRQVVIGGKLIADFAAPAVRLVVEVDGAYHMGRAAADAHRDCALDRLGWRVVRLETQLVEQKLHVALERIREALTTVA